MNPPETLEEVCSRLDRLEIKVARWAAKIEILQYLAVILLSGLIGINVL